jgi:hypothetical protein
VREWAELEEQGQVQGFEELELELEQGQGQELQELELEVQELGQGLELQL